MEELELKQELLNGRKTERIIFAVTPALKKEVARMAERDCVTTSALITRLLAEEVIRRAK